MHLNILRYNFNVHDINICIRFYLSIPVTFFHFLSQSKYTFENILFALPNLHKVPSAHAFAKKSVLPNDFPFQGYYKDTVEFYFDERNHCKNFWKKCVEHHGFFRCVDPPITSREKSKIISRGSSFR